METISNKVEIKVGDVVTITDGSSAIRIDKIEDQTHLGLCKGKFKVLKSWHSHLVWSGAPHAAHDIIIENVETGARYVHSKCCVKPAPLELTVADIEKKFGCKVKIVK